MHIPMKHIPQLRTFPSLHQVTMSHFQVNPHHASQVNLLGCLSSQLRLDCFRTSYGSDSSYSFICVSYGLKNSRPSHHRGQSRVREIISLSLLHNAYLKCLLWNLLEIPQCLARYLISNSPPHMNSVFSLCLRAHLTLTLHCNHERLTPDLEEKQARPRHCFILYAIQSLPRAPQRSFT